MSDNPFRSRLDAQFSYLCHHEAGHAVAAMAYGFQGWAWAMREGFFGGGQSSNKNCIRP